MNTRTRRKIENLLKKAARTLDEALDLASDIWPEAQGLVECYASGSSLSIQEGWNNTDSGGAFAGSSIKVELETLWSGGDDNPR